MFTCVRERKERMDCDETEGLMRVGELDLFAPPDKPDELVFSRFPPALLESLERVSDELYEYRLLDAGVRGGCMEGSAWMSNVAI